MIVAMHKEYASLRRRPFLMPLWILTLGGVLGLAAMGWALLAASTTVVVVMRHADKVADASIDPPLSAAGLERARRLVEVFAGGPRDLALDAIFVTQWQRTKATAEPLAGKLGVPVIQVEDSDVQGLIGRIDSGYRGQRVLVIAHSDTVPKIVRALARGVDVPPIDVNEYGTVYVVAVPRWSRSAVLRLALP
jgi:broad specificity phosphatase PhoE